MPSSTKLVNVTCAVAIDNSYKHSHNTLYIRDVSNNSTAKTFNPELKTMLCHSPIHFSMCKDRVGSIALLIYSMQCLKEDAAYL